MFLTGNSSQVQVLSDELLQLTVHGARSETLTEVQPEVLTEGRAWHTHTHTGYDVIILSGVGAVTSETWLFITDR